MVKIWIYEVKELLFYGLKFKSSTRGGFCYQKLILDDETDSFIVYPDPDIKVLEKLRGNRTRTELWDDLPTEVGYKNLMVES